MFRMKLEQYGCSGSFWEGTLYSQITAKASGVRDMRWLWLKVIRYCCGLGILNRLEETL